MPISIENIFGLKFIKGEFSFNNFIQDKNNKQNKASLNLKFSEALF